MAFGSGITSRDLERMLCDETAEPKALPLSLLEEITNGFSKQQRIGSGGFAVVYKGKLENSTVAVKRSTTYMHEKEFQREVSCLMMVKHKNIVRFIGYCSDTQGTMAKDKGKFIMADVQHRLLCFEYLPKGSLQGYITDTSSGLGWRDRYQIIKGICHGLHYLHQKNIVHLDLKPGNILLDDDLVAKIADFGLSRLFGDIESRIKTLNIGGTLGYLAPEFSNGEITYQFDIYSLGVIIMEILTGKKGYHSVDKVVDSWSNILEKTQSEIQQKQVQVCAQIAMECTNFDPAKRPDIQRIIHTLDEIECTDGYIETCVISPQQQINPDMLSGALHALWFSYQRLNPDIRRCIEYCCIFPVGSKLRREKLVCLWIAQGFVKINGATGDIEDVAEGYFQELVSCSFLQPEGTSSDTGCFTIHDALHDLLYKIARDCFRIENTMRHKGEGWGGDVPQDVQHLLIQHYDGELITKKILLLENLVTLIIYHVGYALVEEKVIESICKKLPNLRVLAFAFSEEHDPIKRPNKFSIPESISQLKHLHYLAFRTARSCTVILPSTLANLEHVQLLDCGDGKFSVLFNLGNLINLRLIISGTDMVCPNNIGKMTSLQALPCAFSIRNRLGNKLNELKNINKLRGKLSIDGLENVQIKEEALEANLSAKERLIELKLSWDDGHDIYRCRSPEVQAEVFECLCPPRGLQTLQIWHYKGSRFPDWMEGRKNGGPRELQRLEFRLCCIELTQQPAQLVESFPHLCELELSDCNWDALPSNMDHLTSLKKLSIFRCSNIRELPTLPQSLEEFRLSGRGYEFIKSCQTVGHPNWQKIEHITQKNIDIDSTRWM